MGKYHWGFYCLLLIVSFACKKTNDAAPAALEGRWGWVQTRSDGAPGPFNPLTPFNAGYQRTLIFTGSNFTASRNDTMVSNGRFTLALVKNIYGQEVNQIHYFPVYDALSIGTPIDYITYYTVRNDSLGFSYDLSGTVGSGSELFVKTVAQ